MDVVPNNFLIPQEGILGTDFLKDNAPTDIRYDVQRFVKWHNNSMYKTGCYFDHARTAKVFYVKIKNLEVKMGLIPRLHLGDGLYTDNALVKDRGGNAYIKIINT